MYSCHLFLICSASVRYLPFLSFILPILTWNIPLISPVFLKRSLVFPILLFFDTSLHCSFKKAFLFLLAQSQDHFLADSKTSQVQANHLKAPPTDHPTGQLGTSQGHRYPSRPGFPAPTDSWFLSSSKNPSKASLGTESSELDNQGCGTEGQTCWWVRASRSDRCECVRDTVL